MPVEIGSPDGSSRTRSGSTDRPEAAADLRARRAVEAVWRIESPRLVAALTRIVGDIDLAEELAQDALVAALEQWPSEGVPRNPGGWLMLTAKHRGIDRRRRDRTFARKLELLGRDLADEPAPDLPAGLDPDRAITDDLLRMVFTACHPVLSAPARVALTLRLVGGLTVEEIARAFLVAESTVAQRIVRAKRTIAAKRVPFEVPHGPELARRLESVLEVIYLIFNEGYSATAGADWMRVDLCEEALRLGRVLAAMMPAEPEAHGLAALLELQASRTAARVAPGRAAVLLLDQDRGRWDRLLVRRGFAALAHANRAATTRGTAPGYYALQAAIAAVHAMAATPEETDWQRIAGLYAILSQRFPSPVVELNRAVAVSMAHGPAPALELVDTLAATGALADYHLLPAVRGDLLAKLDRPTEARAEFERAATLTGNGAEQTLLRERARRYDLGMSATPDGVVVIEGRIGRAASNALTLTFSDSRGKPVAVAGADPGVAHGSKVGGPGRHRIEYTDGTKIFVESAGKGPTVLSRSDSSTIAKILHDGGNSTALARDGSALARFVPDPDEPATPELFRLRALTPDGAEIGRLDIIRTARGWAQAADAAEQVRWPDEASRALPVPVQGTRLTLRRPVDGVLRDVLFGACVDIAVGLRPYVAAMA